MVLSFEKRVGSFYHSFYLDYALKLQLSYPSISCVVVAFSKFRSPEITQRIHPEKAASAEFSVISEFS
jgi:hypothetical protein